MTAIRVLDRAPGEIVIADSVTDVAPSHRGAVVVCGSHGGLVAAQFASRLGARAVIFNDAGVGKDDAGVAGLVRLEKLGVPAAAVSHTTARIGDGEDTFRRGVISVANHDARSLGVEPGMSATEAADRLFGAPLPSVSDLEPLQAPRRLRLADPSPPVIGLDSASQVDSSVADAIVVCGSHGGLVNGTPIRHRVLGAFFNDAGVGRDGAGIARLPALAAMGIPAAAVAHSSARIGDAQDAWENGIVSHVNAPAATVGVEPGMTVQHAAALLAKFFAPTLRQPPTS